MSNYSSEHINIIVDTVPKGLLGTFVPGQSISGKVVYTPRAQVDIDHVVIICKGTCFTRITERNGNTTSYYTEKIILFRNLETIFRGPHTIPAGTYVWPFQFQLPASANYSRKSHRRDDQYRLGDQELPPTFKLASSNPQANVTYKLKVKVNPGKFIHKTERTKELPVWSVSPVPLKPPVALDSYSEGDGRFKSNSLRPTQHTFKEKMRHAFTSDASLRTPEINIAVQFKMPRCVSATQYMPVELACKYTKMGQNDPESPELVLDGCTFSLKLYANVRASGLNDHHKSEKETVVSHTIRDNQELLPLDGSFVPIWEPIRLADMTSHVHGLVPTFRTWTIGMCYKMVVKIRIRHVQTGHIWKLESKFPFEILPGEAPVPAYSKQQTSLVEAGPSALYPPQLESENQASSSSSAAPPEFRDDLAPPSYNSGDVWRIGPDMKRAY
ncbi:hypothetical protein QM012_006910 [Aureobasidium pullulans]|uniref:Arrestin-like N-terminal domain-containing protein n=1 Tax=Aureobasidium pullulans TaxID=5580 RepID=A0ABR0TRK7_AURPU